MKAGDQSETGPSPERREAKAPVILQFPARLDDHAVADLWGRALDAVKNGSGPWRFDCSRLDYCGGAGLALLVALEEAAAERGGKCEWLEIPAATKSALAAIDRAALRPPAVHAAETGWIEKVGRASVARGREWTEDAEFVGRVVAGFSAQAARPRRFRLREWWTIVEKAGANALPIVALISFLMGMIMAFQAAMPMRQFGVDIYVVNLVALAMTRELGPIMTAIVFAGRSGSAFAAEIGTMKVNEEVAALQTMGLDPVRFLAVPRVLAGLVVTPVLTVFSMAVGVAGGIFVMLLLGFPLAALTHQLAGSLKMHDVLAGLIKSFFFGATVAGVGCLRGLQTGSGPSAVGDSTTRAVVTSIFLIVLLDAVFAVTYYRIKF